MVRIVSERDEIRSGVALQTKWIIREVIRDECGEYLSDVSIRRVLRKLVRHFRVPFQPAIAFPDTDSCQKYLREEQ